MLPRQGSEKAFWCREEGFTETGSLGPESREASAPDEEDGSLTPSVTRRTHTVCVEGSCPPLFLNTPLNP